MTHYYYYYILRVSYNK